MGNLKSIDYGIGKYLVASDASSVPDIETNRKNLDLLNFKIAVNNAYSLYNFKDGMIDGYQSEDGVDTGASSNYIYDSTNKVFKVSGPPTGGTVTTYTSGSDYTVHTFSASGTQTYFPDGGPTSELSFVVSDGGTADVLIVAGGGAGGGADARQPSYPRKGGGGAGGGVVDGSTTFNAGTYTITTALGGLKDPNHVIGGGGGISSISEPTWGTVTANFGFGGGGSGQNGGPHDGSRPASANGAGAGGGNHSGSPQGGGRWSGAPQPDQPSFPTQGLTGRGGYDGGDGHVNANGGSGGGATAAGVPNGIPGGAGYASSIRDGNSYTYGTGGKGGTGSGVGPDATLFGEGGGGSGMGTPGNVEYGGNGYAGLVVIRYVTGSMGAANMTLESNAQTAQASPDEGRLMLYEQDTDSITPGTDIKGYVSRDGGTTWSGAVGLVDDGFLNVVQGNDNYTKLLLHMDGANDGTTFTDDSASAHTVTRTDTVTKTSIKKFGTASCYQDGTGTDTVPRLSVPNSTDWDFGTGTFTIDFWLYLFQTSSNLNQKIIGCSNYSSGWQGWHIKKDNALMKLNWEGGANTTAFNTASSTALTAETWTHVAVVKSGTTTKLYFDGVEKFSLAQNYAIQSTGSEVLEIGEGGQDAYWELPKMYIDEVRVSKGIARWTAAFTPPTSPYATNTRLLSGSVDISGQPAGTDMKYKVETLNDKNLILHGASLLWA